MKKLKVLLLVLTVLLLAGCGKKEEADQVEKPEQVEKLSIENDADTSVFRQEEIEEEPVEPEPEPEPEPVIKGIVVIDAGHQLHGNSEQEPIGPGASQMKAKVTGGTSGISTGIPEYELALQVAKKLQVKLEGLNYQVIMCRETNEVDISNSERAQIANDNQADVFIRIHANGSENHNATGAMTICQTPSNPYNGDLYESSQYLATCVLDEFVTATGCVRERVWETDSMSGINWCRVPAIIMEMGYMTNPQEDELMATEEYQELMVDGMANGIERYMGY